MGRRDSATAEATPGAYLLSERPTVAVQIDVDVPRSGTAEGQSFAKRFGIYREIVHLFLS